MESSFSGTQSFPEALSPDRGTQPIKHHRWANICLWELPGRLQSCWSVCKVMLCWLWVSCSVPSRASASLLTRCPSIFLAADIKGNGVAHYLPLWVMPVLQEAFTGTIRAAGTAQPVEQLEEEEPLKKRLSLSVFVKLMTHCCRKTWLQTSSPF